MKTYTITKKQVIKALETEPILQAGKFFHTYEEENKKICKVCVVGAVIRQNVPELVSVNIWPSNLSSRLNTFGSFIPRDMDYSDFKEQALRSRHPLNSLSIFFEGLKEIRYMGYVNDEGFLRAELVNFVCATFPESFEI